VRMGDMSGVPGDHQSQRQQHPAHRDGALNRDYSRTFSTMEDIRCRNQSTTSRLRHASTQVNHTIRSVTSMTCGMFMDISA
jgi:hypothetical protein